MSEIQKGIMYMIIIGVKEKALANTVPAAFPTLCADKKHIHIDDTNVNQQEYVIII